MKACPCVTWLRGSPKDLKGCADAFADGAKNVPTLSRAPPPPMEVRVLRRLSLGAPNTHPFGREDVVSYLPGIAVRW